MIESMIQQYLAPAVQWFFGLFAPAEWKAFVLLVGVTLVVTQVIKFTWRILPFLPMDRLTYRREVMYLITVGVGFVFAWPIWPDGFSWWIPGILSGTVAAFLFKAAFFYLKKFAPDFATSFNADRRRADRGPPGGIERRDREAP